MAILTCHLCEQPIITPVPADGQVFCCHGCRELWRLLGEEQVALLRSRPGVNWENVRDHATPSKMDAPVNLQAQTVTLDLDGIWCASCSILVEEVLHRTAGVIGARVDFASSSAEVAIDANSITPGEIRDTVIRLGYGAKERDATDEWEGTADLQLLRRFSVSAVLAFIIMMASVPIWTGYLPLFTPVLRDTLTYGLWALSTPVLFWGGWPFLRGAWASLLHRVPTMDLLIALGSLSAYGYSVFSVFTGGKYLYFDTASLLVTFLLLSRNLEAGTRNRASGVIQVLSRFVAKEAHILREGKEEKLAVSHVRSGDRVIIRPGQRIPVDGHVVSGTSAVDESILTGESLFVEKRSDHVVYAGTMNHSGVLIVETTRSAGDTVLEQTAKFVKMAQEGKGSWKRLADVVLRIFVPAVIALSGSTFLYWRWVAHLGFTDSLLIAISVLVVACPCALSVATPLASLAGIQKLGERGVLLRSPDALERIAAVDTVILDKTGTLTTESMSLARFMPPDEAMLQLAASAELGSEHPIGRAIVKAAEDLGLTFLPSQEFQTEPGWGISCTVNGHQVCVGATLDARLSESFLENQVSDWEKEGRTTAFVLVDGTLEGVLFFENPSRPESHHVVTKLQDAGLNVMMATGDNFDTARRIASETGIREFYAHQKPLDKADLVKSLQEKGRKVAFVGDGINDAPALVQADLGVAMGSGTDVALEAGHLILIHSKLDGILHFIDIGQKTTRIIKQNLTWALLYNVAALCAAAAGHASPAAAALAMVLSSAFVLGNSLRILNWSPRRYIVGILSVAGLFGALLAMTWLGI